MRYVDGDGREVYLGATSSAVIIKDYITGETIVSFTPTSSKSFIIGSLKDKSYILIDYSGGARIRLFFEDEDYERFYYKSTYSLYNIQRYIDNSRKLYYIGDSARLPEQRLIFYNGTYDSYYKNSIRLYNVGSRNTLEIRNNDREIVYEKDLRSVTNKIFKVTLIKDGITTTDYYYYIDVNNWKFKIGKVDGTYLCYDTYGSIIPESDFPSDAELEYEYTFNYDLPETETT